MAESKNKKTGAEGEEIAAAFLARKGYRILQRNLRLEKAEIDIVAMDGEQLVFVEVKTRSSDMVEPERAVTKAKQRTMMKAAELYQDIFKMENELRFDIIAIYRGPGKTEIVHFEDAFYPVN